jgi:rhamnulokinase
MKDEIYLAIDLGAESGRVMSGTFHSEKLQIDEIHRFTNSGVGLGGHLYWDVLRLWSEIKDGLRLAGSQFGAGIKSIGLDTWGVDFGLLDADDKLIGNPFHYRDRRTDGTLPAVFDIIDQNIIYAQTGSQFLQINSLFQLFAMTLAKDPALSIMKRFLNMPDLFNFFLTGVKANEYTIVSTTQCYDPVKKDWAFNLLATLGIPDHIFGEIVSPGTFLGRLQAAVADETGLRSVAVIASAGHDTASAVAAVPAISGNYIYLSSGTWSLMGVELERPMINADSLSANMTHEGGLAGKIRFLKNIVGLWLVQECRRVWAHQGNRYSYAELTQMAETAVAFGPLIDPDDRRFLAPQDMPAAIQSYCKETGQPVPGDKGAILRCVMESLALEYRRVAEQIDRLTGRAHSTIHIIGGGSQNKMLNQLTANATGKVVVAGPVESTAVGNMLVQAIAMGEIASLAEGRQIVRYSFDLSTFQPEDVSRWDQAYERYLKLKIQC